MDFARKSDALGLVVFTSVEITLPEFGQLCKGKKGNIALLVPFFVFSAANCHK
ncbi:MAG: hypothetical protein ACK5X3_03995 [Pseudomonadota bacterium]